MPYKNEHACRINSPDKYEQFNRVNCDQKHDGKCIDVIYGVKDGKSEIQALRYKKDIWTEEAARDHCKSREGTFEPAAGEEKDINNEPERRYFPIQEMRAIEEDDGKLIIEGYPIVYEVYAPIWGFREIIRRGAATEALKTSDEMVLWDHESSQPMARRSNGTLEVKEDDRGVFIHADVSKTIWGRNGYEAIKNKVIDKMSFAFDVDPDGEKWRIDEVEGVRIETREIVQFAQIYDYSPVSYPAYKQTIVDARSRELALRNKPEPGAPGEAGAAALEVRKEARANIEQLRKHNLERCNYET